MASSRNSAPVDDAVAAVTTAVADALDGYVASGRAALRVALSGGIDSMVLLDALTGVSAGRSLKLSAVHVHHGLSPNADQWARFCAEQCASRIGAAVGASAAPGAQVRAKPRSAGARRAIRAFHVMRRRM